MKRLISSLFLFAGISPLYAQDMSNSQLQTHVHAEADVPIGIMGGHTHNAGGIMLSYRYMEMHMKGNRDGKSRISNSEVLANYMVTPTSMDMKMHMLGAMYAVNDRLTVMGMLPYVTTSMKHLTRTGREFTTRAEGFGDVKISTLYKMNDGDRHKLHLNLGISFPTGSIDERDDTPATNDAKLPYPMQLGSGTYDFMPGITYSGEQQHYSWGAQAIATVRLGENDNDYTLGDKVELSAWLQRKFSNGWSSSMRLNAHSWSDIDGADPDLNPAMISTADPELRAGKRVDLLVGLSYHATNGDLKGNRFAVEIGKPVYQKLDGPQLETDFLLMVGWQHSF